MKNDKENLNEHMPSMQAAELLCVLTGQPFVNQRVLAEATGQSLGVVNRSLKELTEAGYLDEGMRLTERGRALLNARRPHRAVILAAGAGMRMVPINHTAPKALIEARGERLIERIIRQLHEVGIEDITVVVGFMKESFEYLIDDFGVRLRVNRDYATTNNLRSLGLVLDGLSNAYVIPCDLWCAENPFRRWEPYSWYMVTDRQDTASDVRVNRKRELTRVAERAQGNHMVGIAYLTGAEAEAVKAELRGMLSGGRHDGDFWEAALWAGDRMRVPARVVRDADVVEINTYEQLREFDAGSDMLKSEAMQVIASALCCAEADIRDIVTLKKGMTNRSFRFTALGRKYIMRIPGEGTDKLIDRRQEAAAFAAIRGLGLCDDPVYLNPENGYKITRYLEGVRVCDPQNADDLARCMQKLRAFHDMRLTVGHAFDIFGQIEYYESLWEGTSSAFRDYARTKENVLRLKPFIDAQAQDWCLTHIDAVPDNFLFYMPDGGAEEQLQLTDWEYAGMQDPHVDIAMFCVYSLYDRADCDRLIDLYFEGACDRPTRAKLYSYIAACGLLWSNWCEYKRKLGMEFGEYSLRQYRYAKDFYKYAVALIHSEGGKV